ncbi:MAG: hypothetical protein E7478_09070 [Ruminococcaceae bacterium]|nr:hypothetical protein [Oscillospiraceae bacterium]
MKKLSGFKLAYIIFLGICILLSAVFLIYVHCVIKEYDRAQPERVVEQQMEWLTTHSADGTLGSELGFAELCSNRYENNDANRFAAAYADRIKGAELTYEFIASQSGDMKKAYSILADGEPVGTLSLSGQNNRTSLFFFSMADWSADGFEPIIADTVYNLTVYRPAGTKVFINGVEPTDAERTEGSYDAPAYAVKGLLNEPEIEYMMADGSTVSYTTENNVVKPIVYNYQITVPAGLKVAMNGQQLSGEPAADGQMMYTIRDMTEPKVSFTDSCNNTYTFLGGNDVTFYPHKVTLPANYSLTINGIDADSFCTAQSTPHPDAAVMMDKAGVQLPDLKTYEFVLLLGDAEAVITDENGVQNTYTLTDSPLELTTLNGSDTIPEDIAAQIDVMETAKNWSRFMTDDLAGELHGLYTVYDFLIKDSDYYRFAYEWATGIDITFTSTHTIDSFTNESISNFNQYNENCFSCEVYFEKNMSLYRGSTYVGARTDVFHSIMYFVYTDDTPDNGIDDPHWAIAVMHDVL